MNNKQYIARIHLTRSLIVTGLGCGKVWLDQVIVRFKQIQIFVYASCYVLRELATDMLDKTYYTNF